MPNEPSFDYDRAPGVGALRRPLEPWVRLVIFSLYLLVFEGIDAGQTTAAHEFQTGSATG
jgi:hypothetical protein